MKTRESFVEYCKQYIINHVGDFEGQTHYACDFTMTITESPNVDGTLTYSTHEAMEYIREWWWEAGEYWQYEKDNFGENFHNPFENPEAYMVCMVIEGCSSILGGCPVLEENWNDQIEITPEVIESIKSYVEDFNYEKLF